MKKIFTLFLAVALLSTAGFAQSHHADKIKNYGYATPYNHSWEKKKHDKSFNDLRKHHFDRHSKFFKGRKKDWYKHHRFHVREDRIPRKKLSIKLILG